MRHLWPIADQVEYLTARQRADLQAADVPPPTFRGNNLAIQAISETCEFLLSGPYQTGKTFAGLYKLDSLCREYARARGAIIRKVGAAMHGTVLETWREIIAMRGGVTAYGGERPEWYIYPNGSRVYVGGIDKPGKTLSGERDFIYVNQAEELDREDWETLSTRATGRSGRAPFALLFGDCNPGPPTHWILGRPSLQLLPTTHRDNPTLYADDGTLTPLGVQTMKVLDELTGHQRSRGRDGMWAAAAGLVYDEVWSDTESVTDDADYVAGAGPVYAGVDDGYSAGSAPNSRGIDPKLGSYVADAHPRVFLLAQQKPDGHLDVFYESYACLRLSDEHIADVLAEPYPAPEFAAHGPGFAELRGRLFAANIYPRQGTSAVDEGIKEVRRALAPDTNGWRRVRVHPRCKHLRLEMASYRYDEGTEKPVKAHDHGPDSLRYLCWALRHEQ